MSALTENEVLAKHAQCLGDAERACFEIGRNADPDYISPRGKHYIALREAVKELEGSARQMSMFRQDARWTRLGFFYGTTILRKIQAKFVQRDWKFFWELRALFREQGLRNLNDLKESKTGTTGPVLPKRASEWLWTPDHRPVVRGPGTLH